MSLIKRMRKQDAVWWERSAAPDEYNKWTFAAPVQIACRWVDKVGEFQNEKGETTNSKAEVYVDREMKLGDFLQKGELDSNTPLDPADSETALPLVGWVDTPNLKNTEHLYKAIL